MDCGVPVKLAPARPTRWRTEWHRMEGTLEDPEERKHAEEAFRHKWAKAFVGIVVVP